MKKALGLLGILVLFLIAVFAALAFFPPTGLAKRMLVGGTKFATGLDLQLNGPVTLRLVPSIDLHMENVVVTNPTLPGGKPIAMAKVVEVSSGYASFIGGGRSVDLIKMTDPVIELETDAQGRSSWIAAAPTTRDATARTSRPFAIGRVDVTGGTIDFRDQRTGFTAKLERTQATLREVTTDKLGEALVKAGAAVIRQPANGMTVEVADLDANAKSVEPSRIGTLTAGGSVVRWRDAIQTAGVEGAKTIITAQALGFDGAGAVTINSGSLTWRDPAGGGTLNATGFEANARSLKGGRLEGIAFKSGGVTFAHRAGGKLNASSVTGTAATAMGEGLDGLQLKSSAATLEQPGAGTLVASNLSAAAKSAKPSRLEGVAFESASLVMTQPTRSPGAPATGTPFDLQQVSMAAPVLAFGTPVDAAVAFVHNKDRVEGNVKLPTPEALMAGPSIPANVALKAARGNVDFDGRIETGATTTFKGRTRAATTSVDALAGWLGMTVPATLKGAVTVTGDVEAQGSRIALNNGRVEHGGNTMTGAVAVDMAGARPKISGRIAADKLDADAYLGLEPVKPTAPRPQGQATQPRPRPAPKPEIVETETNLSDVFKSYVRGMLDAPPKRSGPLSFPDLSGDDLIPATTRAKPRAGSFTWSDQKFDLTALRAVDLDIDWSVRSLTIRGIELNAPQLKTQLDAGALTLEGRDVGTKDGRISGKAHVDVRQPVPQLAATVKGTGVDLLAMSEAFGIPPMVEGITSIDADVKTRGNTQKQLVEGLSGKVKSEMPQGNVIGYDFGNLSLAVILRWFSGNREVDPERRTPISGLKADLDIDKGVVKDSTVTVGGPFLGVNAEGTIGLIEQRLDYRGRARIASIFSGLPFKLFGDWSRPSFQPDLSIASVFSRSVPGEPTLADIVAAAEIKPDPELALMIGRVIQKAGPNGLDAATSAFLAALQKKAIGN